MKKLPYISRVLSELGGVYAPHNSQLTPQTLFLARPHL